MCAKATEGAADFEAQAAALDKGKHAARSVRYSLSYLVGEATFGP